MSDGPGLSFCSHLSETRIGAGALDYDFGALKDADNKLTKSYENLAYGHSSSTS